MTVVLQLLAILLVVVAAQDRSPVSRRHLGKRMQRGRCRGAQHTVDACAPGAEKV